MQASRLRWWVSGAKFAMFVSSEIGTAATSTVLADHVHRCCSPARRRVVLRELCTGPTGSFRMRPHHEAVTDGLGPAPPNPHPHRRQGFARQHLRWLLLKNVSLSGLASHCTRLHTSVLDGGQCWPRRLTDAPLKTPARRRDPLSHRREAGISRHKELSLFRNLD